MVRRILNGCWRFTGGIVAAWLRHRAIAKKCRAIISSEPNASRAVDLGTQCPDCACERCSVGRFGSPGIVKPTEMLHSVVIKPVDSEMKKDELWYTFITHAEEKGMSVLREAACDEEFKETIRLRLKDDVRRSFHGVVSFRCSSVRSLVARTDGPGRIAGDRLYCILDSDADGRRHHADVFATPARPGAKNKTAWRRQRGDLMDLMRDNFQSAQEFRKGALT
jgi:hypothetical protein